jgi:hypothetical protein
MHATYGTDTHTKPAITQAPLTVSECKDNERRSARVGEGTESSPQAARRGSAQMPHAHTQNARTHTNWPLMVFLLFRPPHCQPPFAREALPTSRPPDGSSSHVQRRSQSAARASSIASLSGLQCSRIALYVNFFSCQVCGRAIRVVGGGTAAMCTPVWSGLGPVVWALQEDARGGARTPAHRVTGLCCWCCSATGSGAPRQQEAAPSASHQVGSQRPSTHTARSPS